MKRSGVIALVVVLGGALASGAFLFLRPNTRTATTYSDGGWVYQCSRPVKVKNQGARSESGALSPTPTNPANAAKYCRKIGIE